MNLFKLIKDLEAQGTTAARETEEAVKILQYLLSDGLTATLSYIQDAERLV
jgi:hypothetical protein